ncbi:hypothetical protein [Roseicyclus mahoneyensis]|nr:hypothetical protein [Roseicyclus mahoneyensis]
MSMPAGSFHVSITGLRLRHPGLAPIFWWHAVRSMAQARAAEGNLSAQARIIAGVHHTVSVWHDRDAMLAYLRSGAHLRAMRLFRRIATGWVAGYAADQAPDWNNVPTILQAKGRAV